MEYITAFTEDRNPMPVPPEVDGISAKQWKLVSVVSLGSQTGTFYFYWLHEVPEKPPKPKPKK